VPPIAPSADGIRLLIHVQPRASRTELAGLHGDALKIRLAAPPVDGAANDVLLRFLAEILSVPRSRLDLTSGHTSRRKVVLVQGVTVDAATRALRLGDR
jgi:hypothetical protein